MKKPVLFLIFNRPDTTEKVFQAIRNARPPRLYVAADGPRPQRIGEDKKCAITRDIIKSVDWNCEVHTLFRKDNLGCKRSVSEAINWFFENEEEGIILEDDILPHPDFFKYCEELLERYRDTDSIGVISGHNHVYDSQIFNGDSYGFVAVSHCWGWASWRKSWQKVDISLNRYSVSALYTSLLKLYDHLSHRLFWLSIFYQMKSHKINSWAYPMTLSFMINNMLSIVPAENLTKNIGDGDDATHTSELSADERAITLTGIYPLTHPEKPALNNKAEQLEILHENRVISPINYLKIRIKLILSDLFK